METAKAPEARIGPLPRAEWTDAAREVFAFWGEPDAWEEGSKTSIIMAMANHPELATAFNIWGKHLLVANQVPVRERELIILRVSWHTRSEYEWHNHVGYAISAGMSLEEIAAIVAGPDAGDWSELDRTLLRAVDEQMTGRIGDESWATLSKYFDRRQLMDLVFTIGNYVMMSWAINSLDIPLEDGADVIGFDLKTKSGRIPGVRYKPGETEDWTSTRGF